MCICYWVVSKGINNSENLDLILANSNKSVANDVYVTIARLWYLPLGILTEQARKV